MKKSCFLIVMICSLVLAGMGQSAKEMLKEIEGQYELDDIGNVTYTRVMVFDSLKRDEIYSRAMLYFVYKYGSGKDVIQTADKEAGTIVGKGIYGNVHTGVNFTTTIFDTEHLLRIDVKDGKAKVMVTLTSYITRADVGYGSRNENSVAVGLVAPFGDRMKTMGVKAFAKSHERVQLTFLEVERAIRRGNTGKEKVDW